MRKHKEDLFSATANISANDDVYILESTVFYRSSKTDYTKGNMWVLGITATATELGEVTKKVFSASRMVNPKSKELAWSPEAREIQKEYEAIKLKKLGYKTKTALYKNMKSVFSDEKDGWYIFKPSIHERLVGWSGFPVGHPTRDRAFIVSKNATNEEVGRTLKEAFSFCE